MLYSDDDVDSNHEGPIRISHEESDETHSDDEELFYRQEENYEQQCDFIFAEYSAFYMAEDGWFRSCFPHLWVDETDTALPYLGSAVAIASGTVELENIPETEVVRSQPAPTAPSYKLPIIDGEFAKKESKVSRSVRNGEGIVFSIDPTTNRQQLINIFAATPSLAEISADALAVGYERREPIGMGIAIVSGRLRDAVLSEMNGARQATAEDAKYFMKEIRLSSNPQPSAPQLTSTVSQPSRPPGEKQRLRDTLNLMKSTDALRQCIASAGGESSVRWLTLDVECAIVLERAVSIPLEIALADFHLPDEACTIFHTFVHPGNLASVAETAMGLSLGYHGMGHGIPIHSATFLRRDYHKVATELLSALSGPNTVVVFKGDSITDFMALKWVYAVADLTAEGESPTRFVDTPLPHFTALDTVYATLGRVSSLDIDSHRSHAKSTCWYHGHRIIASDDRPHCALEDCLFLRECLKEII